MGNSENTAINELIARVSGGPTEPAVGSPAHEAQGSGQHPHVPQLPTSYPVVPRAMLGAVTPLAPEPVAPVVEPIVGPPSWGTSSGGHPWPPPDEPVITRVDQRRVGTLMIRRPSELRVVIGKLVVPVALLVIAGVAIGGYFALRAPGPVHAPELRAAQAVQSPAKRAAEPLPPPVAAVAAPPPVAAVAAPPPVAAVAAPPPVAAVPAPPPPSVAATASAPAITPLAEPPAKLPALVDVRIDSAPSGATVTLIDRGRSQFVGTTPVNVAVDPSREYELMLSHPGAPSRVVRLDANATRRVAVTLGKRARPLDGAARPERAAPPASSPATPGAPDEPSTEKAIDDAK